MELRHLRYFAAVAQYLNYGEASRRLHVAQPAISQTILDLEDELSVKPDRQTVALYDEIRSGSLSAATPPRPSAEPEPKDADAVLPDIVARLKQLHAALTEIQQQVKKEIRTVELALGRRQL